MVVKRNLDTFAPFAATERLLMALAREGADRQQMHEIIREHSLIAWADIQSGKPNLLIDRLAQEEQFAQFLTPIEIRGYLNIQDYLGDAPQRAHELAEKITAMIP